MSLLEPPAESNQKSRAAIFTVVALSAVAIVVLWLAFRYYPEERAARHFFDAVVAGDMDGAYRLWKPGGSYEMKDFLADWGPQGYYGPVKSYKILKTSTGGPGSVAVRVGISPFSPMPDINEAEKSRKTKVLSVWVQTSDKSFSFPP